LFVRERFDHHGLPIANAFSEDAPKILSNPRTRVSDIDAGGDL